jgi:hypothetical protein
VKRPFLAILLVLAVVALAGSAEYFLQRGLDRYLPPLLTEELGLPVSITPTRADIFTLTAHADRLQMGANEDPALVAEGVMVSLNWTDLLSGEIRLVTASADDLMVKVSSWPREGNPLPPDYFFLEQWLPRSIDLVQGRYVFADGDTWLVKEGRWRRLQDGSATLAWHQERPAGSFHAEVALASLDELLGMREFRSSIHMTAAGDQLPDTGLELVIGPAADAAYKLDIQGSLAGMDGSLSGKGRESWYWPSSSSTHIEVLYPGRIIELVKLFVADGIEDDLEQELQSAVPQLDLPWHEGNIRLDEMRVGDELLDEIHVDFLADGALLAITDIRMRGPSGNLRGSAAAVSTDEGWDAALGADVKARETHSGLLDKFLDSDWYLSNGRIRLKSDGTNWGELIDEMTGLLELTGSHRGVIDTPISLETQLDGKPSMFALENLVLKLGESVITGEVRFAGGGERRLEIDAKATGLDLNFLFDEQDGAREAGIPVPEILGSFPGIDVYWDVEMEGVRLPTFELATAKLQIERKPRQGDVTLVGTGAQGGGLTVNLAYDGPPTGPIPVSLGIELEQVDIDRMLGEKGPDFPERTSGTLKFSSEGEDIQEIFQALRGDADLTVEFRGDRNWERESVPEELLQITGLSKLLLEGDRILGVQIDDLDITSTEQDISGTMSIAVDREFLYIAELTSDQLNLNRVLEWFPESPEAADEVDILSFLRDMGSARIDLGVGKLEWLEHPITDLEIRFVSSLQRFDIDRFDLNYRGAHATSSMNLVWKDGVADFGASGEVQSLGVDKFLGEYQLQRQPDTAQAMEGSFTLSGRGRTIGEILSALGGQVKLTGEPTTDTASARKLDIDLKRLDGGMEADVNALVWAGSDLRGKVIYKSEPIKHIDVSLDGGVLDLEPWEQQALAREDSDLKEVETTAGRTGQFIGDFLSSPARLFGGGAEDTKPGERMFDPEPMDLDGFQTRDVRVNGRLDKVLSSMFEARQVELSVNLENGVLDSAIDLGFINGGSGRASLLFNTAAIPPALKGEVFLRDMYGTREQSTYPRSTHTIFSSTGASQAAIAANLNGMIYLEAGRGIIDYSGLTFITTDVATSMFRNLIPGTRDRQPQMRCAITLGQFTNGKGITPYGYAVRTRTANLLGGIEVDLEKEHINIRFQSRSREGAGLSVGNAFSNTVDIAGPLSDPRIVPNAPSLLFRGWAAFMTAGLSIIGESMINRTLASSNPCDTIRDEIRKDLCKTDQPLANSPLACPNLIPENAPMAEAVTEPAQQEED